MMLHIKALQKPIAKECGFDYDADLKEYHKFNHAIAKLGTVDEECRNLRLDIYFFAVEKVFGFKIDKEIKLPEGQAMGKLHNVKIDATFSHCISCCSCCKI